MSYPIVASSRATQVLIVEDSESDATLIEYELDHAGFDIVTCRVETAAELLDALDKVAWDIVICDYRLPAFSAPAALKLVKAHREDLPVIVISGAIGEDTAVEMMRSGAQDYLMKGNLARLGLAVGRELRDAQSRLRNQQVAERLTKARALFEAAAIHMTDGLMIVDQSDRVAFVNPCMAELKGVVAQEAVGRSLWDVTDTFDGRTSRPEETRSRSKAARDSALEGKTSTFECRVGGEHPRDLVVFSFPIRGPDGEMLGYGRLARDVTHEREVDRLKDEFLSMVSHELRTPLNGVIAMTSLLLESQLDEDQRECAEIVRDSGTALVAIVNNILDVSHLQAGTVVLEHVEVDVRTTLERVVDQHIASARAKGIELVGLVDRAVPYLVYGDPSRLQQVLTNLVGNAVKFTKCGDVSVQVRVAADTVGDVVLRCEIVDTGIGADAGTIARAFEPFSQADSSGTRRYGGTGLGLTICKRLVVAWGGQIGASTELGHGSTFWFTVRLKKSAAEVAPRLSHGVGTIRVLVLDPHAKRRAALCEMLAGWGVAVEAAEDAETALRELEGSHAGRPFAAVLMTSLRRGAEVRDFAERSGAACHGRPPPLVQLDASGDLTSGADTGAWLTLPSPPHQLQLLGVLTALVDQQPDTLRRLALETPIQSGMPPSKTVAATAPRVLVVDDSEVNRRVAERMLAWLGYRTESAESGLLAVSLLAVGEYAAVLMDCRMPEMDGITATAEIRRQERAPRRTPIIAMTANAERGDRERCLAAGMDDYLSKPVHLEDMERVLVHWTPSSAVTSNATTATLTHVTDPRSPDGILDADVIAQLRAFEAPGEPSLLEELIDTFRRSAPGHLARLKTALAAGDATALGDAAHVLKGGAAALGAVRLRIAAYDLEVCGREHNLARAAEHMTTFEATCTEALTALFEEHMRLAA